jgi:hypothetical protein
MPTPTWPMPPDATQPIAPVTEVAPAATTPDTAPTVDRPPTPAEPVRPPPVDTVLPTPDVAGEPVAPEPQPAAVEVPAAPQPAVVEPAAAFAWEPEPTPASAPDAAADLFGRDPFAGLPRLTPIADDAGGEDGFAQPSAPPRSSVAQPARPAAAAVAPAAASHHAVGPAPSRADDADGPDGAIDEPEPGWPWLRGAAGPAGDGRHYSAPVAAERGAPSGGEYVGRRRRAV